MDIEIVPDTIDAKLDYIIQILEVIIAAGALQTRLQNYQDYPEGGPRNDNKNVCDDTVDDVDNDEPKHMRDNPHAGDAGAD